MSSFAATVAAIRRPSAGLDDELVPGRLRVDRAPEHDVLELTEHDLGGRPDDAPLLEVAAGHVPGVVAHGEVQVRAILAQRPDEADDLEVAVDVVRAVDAGRPERRPAEAADAGEDERRTEPRLPGSRLQPDPEIGAGSQSKGEGPHAGSTFWFRRNTLSGS